MSRSSRQRDSLTPSLFPFLAVLLCTMGALVLILMLVVSGAQASAVQIAEQSVHRAEEVESQLKLASHGFQKQLTEAQIELEKKRLGLQHLENHIQELLTELEQLKRTVELADADEKTVEDDHQAGSRAISELEKQLLEAHDKLKQKLDKPEGDKPIFAIVPYDGPNGTHRRPIYLECTEQGIRIQPEGVLLQVADLEPPYGPGNPLDAALRTIRAQYAPANHAVTSTAYPLLVVRPSGIRSYAMARAAMSGWDDQFGYELVGEDVDLAFPEGDPGLAIKITQALNLARERQAALIVAMPQKYRGFSERDRPLTGGSGSGEYGAGGSDSGGYASGEYGSEQDGSGSYAGSVATQAGSGAGEHAAGERGGWSNANFDGSSSSGSGDGLQAQPSAGPRGTSADSLLGFGGDAGSAAAGTSPAGASEQKAAGESFFATASGPNNPAGGSYGPGSSYGSAGDASRGESGGTMSVGGSGEPATGGLAGTGSGGTSGGQPGDSANPSAGNSSASGDSGNGASGSAAGGNSGGSQMSGQPATGNQMAMPFKTPGQSEGGSQSSSGSGSAGSAGSASGGSQAGSSGSSSQSSAESSDQQGSPQLSLDKTFNGQKQESAAPVASRRGRGWAWSQGPRTQTPVGRSIRVQCLADRWIVLPDSGKANDPAAITITFDISPQQRAEKLAKVVAERVDSWGLALTGGYWKPTLLVDVGPDAEWRFNQLQQLLEASGLEVQRGK